MQSGHFKTCLRCLIPLPWSDQKQQQRKALTPLFRHDEQKTGKGYASLTKSLRGADKAPKDRRTWGKPFPPASSPVLRLLLRSQCLADRLTGASPPQGNPLFLAADAGGKRLSCNEAPCRSSTMQPHEPDAAQAALCTCKTPRRTEFTDSRSRVPTNFPLPRTNAPCPAKHRLPATGAAVPQGRTRFPPQSIQPHLPFPFAHRVLPRRKTPEHTDRFRQYRPCAFQTGFIGDEKNKKPRRRRRGAQPAGL